MGWVFLALCFWDSVSISFFSRHLSCQDTHIDDRLLMHILPGNTDRTEVVESFEGSWGREVVESIGCIEERV